MSTTRNTKRLETGHLREGIETALLITACYDDSRLVLQAIEGLEAIATWCRDRLEYPDRLLTERPDIRELLEYWAKKGGDK